MRLHGIPRIRSLSFVLPSRGRYSSSPNSRFSSSNGSKPAILSWLTDTDGGATTGPLLLVVAFCGVQSKMVAIQHANTGSGVSGISRSSSGAKESGIVERKQRIMAPLANARQLTISIHGHDIIQSACRLEIHPRGYCSAG